MKRWEQTDYIILLYYYNTILLYVEDTGCKFRN